MRLPSIAALAALLSLAAAPLSAQRPPPPEPRVADSTEVQVLRTRDGTRLVGRVVAVSADSITFESSAGVLRLARANIAALETMPRERMRAGDVWFENPNATRLLFAPTGRMLPRGESYLSNTYIFFVGYAGGVTDRITLGGGLSILPLDDFSDNVFFVTPKVGLYQSERVNVAAGALVGWAGGESESAGIVYGVSTFGSTDHSLTVGGGYGFVGGDFGNEPLVMIGTDQRLSRRIGFVSENYVVGGGDALISYGLRFMGERMTFDLALWNVPTEEMVFPGIPYIDFAFFF